MLALPVSRPSKATLRGTYGDLDRRGRARTRGDVPAPQKSAFMPHHRKCPGVFS
jgi:hypothetical protein